MDHTDFSGANLSGAVLPANLDHVDLSGANLTDSTIGGNLDHANLVGANLSHATVTGNTQHVGCGGTNLTGVTGTVHCGAGTFLSCTGSTAFCGGACLDVATDVSNCGGCGTVCASDPHGTATCQAGVCGLVCGLGYTLTGRACVATVCAAPAVPAPGAISNYNGTAGDLEDCNTEPQYNIGPQGAFDTSSPVCGSGAYPGSETQWNAGSTSGVLEANFASPQSISRIQIVANAWPASSETYTVSVLTATGWVTLAPVTNTIGDPTKCTYNADPYTADVTVPAGSYSAIQIQVSSQGIDNCAAPYTPSWISITEVRLGGC